MLLTLSSLKKSKTAFNLEAETEQSITAISSFEIYNTIINQESINSTLVQVS